MEEILMATLMVLGSTGPVPAEIAVCQSVRPVTEIIIHCSATPAGRDVSVADIRSWHLARGFRDIGYHFVITLDGTIYSGRPVAQIGAHCLGHNANSIGVCYIGGCDGRMRPLDSRTPAQSLTLRRLIAILLKQYPGATLHGHREFAAKACPSYDVQTENYSADE
ncbi:MAG: N-acetylmuramoyl-L-alanine amidase [Clostridium sp.]|nr:N-acetylmuramoyl-L-alanine amidase [Clostridium sp.]